MKAEEIKAGNWYRLYASNETVQVVGESSWMDMWKSRDGRWWSARDFAEEVPRPITDPDGYEISKKEDVMKIDFKVGKKYRRRNGAVVTCTEVVPGDCGFVGFNDDCPVCFKNGQRNIYSEDPGDIVAEAPPLKIELGKTYLDGYGDEYVIVGTHINGNLFGHHLRSGAIAEFTPEGLLPEREGEEATLNQYHLVSEAPSAPTLKTFYVTAEVVLEVMAADEKEAREKALEDIARAEDLVNCNITHVCED